MANFEPKTCILRVYRDFKPQSCIIQLHNFPENNEFAAARVKPFLSPGASETNILLGLNVCTTMRGNTVCGKSSSICVILGQNNCMAKVLINIYQDMG